MTWVQIDDAMADHPKILRLSHGAFRMQIEGLCYANRNLTDGFVPKQAAHRHGKRYAVELVNAGVWEIAGDGYQIHDFDDYQPSKAEVLKRREETADRVRAWRRTKRGNAAGNGVTSASVTPLVTVPPIPNPQPQTLLRSNGVSSTRPIDHLKIRNTEGLSPGVVASIERLVGDLTDATQGTVGRLIKLAQAGASQAHFEDARASIPIMNPKSPSRYACVVVSNHLAKNSAQETA